MRAAGEPAFRLPGIVDVDEVLLDQAQIRAITGGGQDVTIIPSMDGKSPVDIEELADGGAAGLPVHLRRDSDIRA